MTEILGQFVHYSDTPFKCTDKDCNPLNSEFVNLQVNCPACMDVTTSIFHKFEELKNHFEYYADEPLHQQYNPFKEMSMDELSTALDCTIKRDKVSKCITFLNMLNAQTADNQFNIMFSAESSTGKSYISLELAHYFPESEIVELAGASPTSLIHESGTEVIETHDEYIPLVDYIKSEVEELENLEFAAKTQENKKRVTELKRKIVDARKRAKIVVDYEGKIVIFLDQPNVQLLSRLRPFLSHDKKMLEFHITDKNMRGANKTKNVIIIGYSSIIFCTANSLFDEQESTRNIVLSPESDSDKIKDSLDLLTKKLKDKSVFEEWVERNPNRKALMFRIEMIRASKTRLFRLNDSSKVYDIFTSLHPAVRSRHTRDYTRLYSIIYGSALLNVFTRESSDGKITANDIDIKNAFDLYEAIMEANEAGVPPEIYNIYKFALLPAYNKQLDTPTSAYYGLTVKDITKAIFEYMQKSVFHNRVIHYIIPSLVSANLLEEGKLETDKRVPIYLPNVDRPKANPNTLDWHTQ